MATLVAPKADVITPIARNDTHHDLLAADPTVPEFPEDSSHGDDLVIQPAAQEDATPEQPASVEPTTPVKDWVTTKWRPAMGWMYMVTCICDFVVFPVLWSFMQVMHNGSVTTQWQPLTLQGAGLFHIAMGAVLGIAAYGRTMEKLVNKD